MHREIGIKGIYLFRIEYLETALSEMSLKLEGGKVGETEDQAEGAGCTPVHNRGCTPVHTQPKPVPEAAGGRSWVRVVREGEEEDMAELPTNSQGLLPQVIISSDCSILLILASDWSIVKGFFLMILSIFIIYIFFSFLSIIHFPRPR